MTANNSKYKCPKAEPPNTGTETTEEASEEATEEDTEIEATAEEASEEENADMTTEDPEETLVTDPKDVSTVASKVIWLETVPNVIPFLIFSQKTQIIQSGH